MIDERTTTGGVDEMMRMRLGRGVEWGVAACAMAGAVLMAPSSAAAQDPDWGVKRAVKMEAEARTLADQREDWDHAAWLYTQAASLRPVGDPEAVIDLQWAGRLAYYTGDLSQAVQALERAGTRAMEGGDVLTAGSLLVDAAWVASRIGKDRKALAYVKRAEELVAAPVLSDQVRNTVLVRIDQQTGTVTVAADFADDVEDSGPGS